MTITNADYFTFNAHNSALVIGQTGSGKSELVHRYVRRLEKAFSPDKMKYVFYDLKQVEFDPSFENGAKVEYLYTNVRFGKDEDMDYLEELAELAKSRAQDGVHEPLLFIYIEECDMAMQYPDRFHAAVIKINQNAKQANVKLIFSTSRPSIDVIPRDFRDSFDLILSGTLASEENEAEMGLPNTQNLKPYEFIVKEQLSR